MEPETDGALLKGHNEISWGETRIVGFELTFSHPCKLISPMMEEQELTDQVKLSRHWAGH